MVEKRSGQQEAEMKQGLRVLIADPHRDCALTLGMLLKHAGHTVVLTETADNIETAGTIDVAIADPFSYGIHAPTIVSLIQRQSPHAALLAFTGWGQREDIRRCLQQGFHEHLLKPNDTGKLRALVDDLSHTPVSSDPYATTLFHKTRLLGWQVRTRMQTLMRNDRHHRRGMEKLRTDVTVLLHNLKQVRQKVRNLRKNYPSDG